MTDGLLASIGLLLPTGASEKVQPTMTLEVGADGSDIWSAFEAEVPPGFDVGAHRHGHAEEIFYVAEGELDLLAFYPRRRPRRRLDHLAGRRRYDRIPRRPRRFHARPGGLPARLPQPGHIHGQEALPGHPIGP
ncbi:hypothetical protein [Nocardia acidivorans]|uniref:hypothetical protein n=1 Tax=Nocardia acidivorans TaxID=404580 RepID=UPI00082C11DB|nr:hypothetical protein [Nocardia acidivorans]